jgi:hypothetical protein
VDLTELAVTLGIFVTNIQPQIDHAILSLTNTAQKMNKVKLAGSNDEEVTQVEAEVEKSPNLEEQEVIALVPQPGTNLNVSFIGIQVNLVASHSSDALTFDLRKVHMKIDRIGQTNVQMESGEGTREESKGMLPPLEFTLGDISIKGKRDVPLLYRSDAAFLEKAMFRYKRKNAKQSEENQEETKTETVESILRDVPFIYVKLSNIVSSAGETQYDVIDVVNVEIQGKYSSSTIDGGVGMVIMVVMVV